MEDLVRQIKNQRNAQKHKKMIIGFSYAQIDKFAMVVEGAYTPVTFSAVLRPKLDHPIAKIAKTKSFSIFNSLADCKL